VEGVDKRIEGVNLSDCLDADSSRSSRIMVEVSKASYSGDSLVGSAYTFVSWIYPKSCCVVSSAAAEFSERTNCKGLAFCLKYGLTDLECKDSMSVSMSVSVSVRISLSMR
jgi:hypothetical protein